MKNNSNGKNKNTYDMTELKIHQAYKTILHTHGNYFHCNTIRTNTYWRDEYKIVNSQTNYNCIY